MLWTQLITHYIMLYYIILHYIILHYIILYFCGMRTRKDRITIANLIFWSE